MAPQGWPAGVHPGTVLGSRKIVLAASPRVPVPRVMRPMSSLKTTTLGRLRAMFGTTYSRIMHSILVRNVLSVATFASSCLNCMAKTRGAPGFGSAETMGGRCVEALVDAHRALEGDAVEAAAGLVAGAATAAAITSALARRPLRAS